MSLDNPEAGTYLVIANMYSITQPLTWDLTSAVVTPGGAGSFTATPNPLPVQQGVPATYTVTWSGLEPGTRYLGVVG